MTAQRPARLAGAFVVLLLLLALPGARGFIHAEGEGLPDFDKRSRGEAVRAKAAEAGHRDAVSRLREQVGDVRVDLDEVLGTPKWVRSERGALSGPNGLGRGVPARAAAGFAPNDPHRTAKSFLREHRALFGHDHTALTGATVQREFSAPRTGLRTVVWQQHLDGIPVFEGMLIAHTARNEALVGLSSRFHPSPGPAANIAGRNRAAFVASPGVSAKQAIVIAAGSVEEPVALAGVSALDAQPKGAERNQRFKAGGLPGETRARLVWLPMDAKELRLCWEVFVTRRAHGESFRVLVDARTGEALVRQGLTVNLADASYRVWTSDSPSPFSPGWPVPNTNQPPLIPRTLITTNAVNTNASPAGWIDDGDNETRGNNVDAHLDRNGDDAPDLPRPQGSPDRVFDFSADLAQSPLTYGNASVVQVFYWCNWMHDKLYELGFTEAAGNFQVDNFGRGGLGGDAVQADAQDGSGTANANFTTPQDGAPPRMQTYLFTAPGPDRDGGFDAEVILHEYTHGLSNRRVGGGVGITSLQGRGLGEGWSDFYALALLSEPGDDVNGVYATGGYLTWLLNGTRDNYYFGIRRYPYSTDLSKNPLTFKDIDPSQAGAHPGVPRGLIGGAADEVHSQGEVWCVTLWEARARLIQRYGWPVGNQLILQLLTDAMNLTPANPNFIQARDAILQADVVANGGANLRDLWAAFARRGLGAGASSPSSDTTTGVIEAFDVPDDLVVRPGGGFTGRGPEGGPFTPNVVTFTLTNSGTNAITWSVARTNTWLSFGLPGGSLLPGATADVMVLVAAGAASLPAGIYFDALRFSNHFSSAVQTRSCALRVGQSDFFTELFETNDNDLAFQSVTFMPDGSASYYAACREVVTDFPTDPAGGTVVFLTDDSSVSVTLPGTNKFGVYGRRTNTFHIGSNGYLTFDQGDSGYTHSLNAHFAVPRVAALFDDLDPENSGVISWRQLSNRVAVTWQNVPEYSDGGLNSFQIEMFFNGNIRITWLALADPIGLAGLSGGNGVPPAYLDSDFSAYGRCEEPLRLSLPLSALEGAGVLPEQGHVQLPFPTATNVVIALKSNDGSEIGVPSSVTVLAGQTDALFAITIQDDTELDGPQTVAVTATAQGFASAMSSMIVVDNETAVLSVSLPASTAEGFGTVTGLVQVSRAPAANFTVRLASSDVTALQTPLEMTVPAGQTTAVFVASVLDDTLIEGSQSVLVTASVPGWLSGSASITVLDDESLNLTILLPAQRVEGQGTLLNAGRVRLSGALPTNLVVALSSDDSTELSVPATVTIAAGQMEAAFDLIIVDDEFADGTQTATVTASATGFGTVSASLSILDDETPLTPATPSPPHLASNVVTTALAWRNDGGEATRNGGFESGDFTGWHTEDTGPGGWLINNGSYVPFSRDVPTPPLTGGFSAITDQQVPGRHLLWQELTVPVCAGPATLRWADRIRNFAADFASTQYFRVEIRDTGNQPLAVAFETQPGDPMEANWVPRSFDLTPWRGQAIRLAFIEEDASFNLNVHLDAISVDAPSGAVTNDVYFGTNPNPGPAELLGRTTNTTWSLPPLAPLTTYYWRIVAQRAGVADGPVWQFTTRGVDHFVVSAVPTPQRVNQPFAVTVAAKDAFGTIVTNYTGPASLSGSIADGGFTLLFRDDFEDGDFVDWELGLGAYQREVTAAAAGGGARCLTLRGGSQNHSDGLAHTFAALQPERIRFHVRANTLDGAGGFVVLGEGAGGPSNVVAFFSMNAPAGGMGLTESQRGDHFVPYQPEQWYQVTLALHWSSRSLDYFVDGSLVEADIPFSGADADHISRLVIYNYDNLQAWWDDFEFLESAPPALVAISPTSTGAFTDGVWTGDVTVLEPATNLFLTIRDGSGRSGVGNPFSIFVENDLAITMTSLPNPVDVGTPLTCLLTVLNAGPATADDVLLTNTLPPGVSFISVSSSQGDCANLAGSIVCSLGALAGGASATVTLVITPLALGSMTNVADVSRAGTDPFPGNNTAMAVTTVRLPTLYLGDATVWEGDAGTATAGFPVRLSSPAGQIVSVSFATADGTASSLTDFIATNGVLTFAPGETNRFIPVPVRADTQVEATERFTVLLFSADGALVGRSAASGTIRNDDAPLSASLPFTETWESGQFQRWWTVTGTPAARSQITSANNPRAGAFHLTLDNSSDGDFSARNEVTLQVNLGGLTNVLLGFWAAGFGDEPNGPPPQPFSGGADFDGVAVSMDGETWWEVQGLRSLASSYTQYVVDLDVAARNFGLTYTTNFLIRFNQFDDYSIPTDGLGLDDISITGVPCCGGSAGGVRILGIDVTNGLATLHWESTSGESYRVEYTTELGSTIWTPAGNITATSTITSLTNDIGADTQRFYRVVRP